MPSIAPTFITYTTKHPSPRVRHLKNFHLISLNTVTRPRILKKSIDLMRQTKYPSVAVFENVDRMPAKAVATISRAIQNSSKFLTKAIFKCASSSFSSKTRPIALKRLFKRLSHLQTLSLINFESRYLKYCRSLKNLSISTPEDPQASLRALSKVRRLQHLERAEVSVLSAEQALMTLNEAQKGVNSKNSMLNLTFLKTQFTCMDNIETISGPSFKKVAEVDLELAKLSPVSFIQDHEKLKQNLKFLRFLVEAARKGESKGFECVKFPGMKVALDQSEYSQPRRRGCQRKQLKDLDVNFKGSAMDSFLLDCLSVYSSSIFSCVNKMEMLENLPEQNEAKLHMELKSTAKPKEVVSLLKDVVESKNIKRLHLEIEAKRMSNSDFKMIVENVSKIENLEYLYISSDSFDMHVEQPCKIRLENLLDIERGRYGRVRA